MLRYRLEYAYKDSRIIYYLYINEIAIIKEGKFDNQVAKGVRQGWNILTILFNIHKE